VTAAVLAIDGRNSKAGIDPRSTLAQHAAVYLAGADFPREAAMLLERASRAGWASRSIPGQ
jgi:hypothetical protein